MNNDNESIKIIFNSFEFKLYGRAKLMENDLKLLKIILIVNR